MIEKLILAPWQRYVRFLSTDNESVSVLERWVRALLLMVPSLAGFGSVWIRAALRGPLIVDGTAQDGLVFRCRFPDILHIYIYLFGTWEPDLSAFLRRRLRRGDVFVDVGANIGYVTACASKLVGPSGAVVAIEASPAVLAVLQETVARNDLTNVRVVPAAVSDGDHELSLFVGPNYNVGLTSTVARKGLREQGRVRAAALGSLLTREELSTARLIKIDVEGGEDRVLAGMLASIDALAADAELVVELSPKWWRDPQLRPIDVLRPFLDRGFNVYMLPNDYSPWRYLWPRDVGAPKRLRDFAILERRVLRLDVVLSRTDADSL